MESSEPRPVPGWNGVPVEPWQIEASLSLPEGMRFQWKPGAPNFFEPSAGGPGAACNGDVLVAELISRAAAANGTRRGVYSRWLADLASAAPDIIFAAGPAIREESRIHLIAISHGAEMMEAVRSGMPANPPGVWVHYTWIRKDESGLLTRSSLVPALWLNGVLAGEAVFRSAPGSRVIRKLFDESAGNLRACPVEMLAELALFEAYRKFTGRLPDEAAMSFFSLCCRLEEMSVRREEIFAESEIALMRRGVVKDVVPAAMGCISSYFGMDSKDKDGGARKGRPASGRGIDSESFQRYSEFVLGALARRMGERPKAASPPPPTLEMLVKEARKAARRGN